MNNIREDIEAILKRYEEDKIEALKALIYDSIILKREKTEECCK